MPYCGIRKDYSNSKIKTAVRFRMGLYLQRMTGGSRKAELRRNSLPGCEKGKRGTMNETRNAASHAENPMGCAPVNPLLIKLAVPMMISMMVQALYNVVDSVFVSRVSEDALSALSLAFPMQNLLISFAVGTAVGVNALLSKSLGEKNYRMVNDAARNGLFLSCCTCVFFTLFGLFGVKAFFNMQTQSETIRQYGVDYLGIVCAVSIFCFLQCMLEKLLVATGRSFYAMLSQLSGALTNIILDPIMIYGLFGFPRMEAAGAAIATVCGQLVGCVLALCFNFKFNKDVQLSFRGFRPRAAVIARIYNVAAPSIAMQAIGSVMTFCMNTILMAFSSTAVAVFGAYFKLQSFVFMPIFGLNNGMVPIVSYNYGARKPERIMKTIRLAWCYAIGIMFLGFLAAQLAPRVLLGMFDASEDMMGLGVVALHIISIHFLMAGFSVVTSSVFQALGQGIYALLVSVGRQLFVLIPVAYLLSLSGNVNLVWWAFPIAEGVSVVLCIVFFMRVHNKIIRPLFQSAG